jgi:hypothetical protein
MPLEFLNSGLWLFLQFRRHHKIMRVSLSNSNELWNGAQPDCRALKNCCRSNWNYSVLSISYSGRFPSVYSKPTSRRFSNNFGYFLVCEILWFWRVFKQQRNKLFDESLKYVLDVESGLILCIFQGYILIVSFPGVFFGLRFLMILVVSLQLTWWSGEGRGHCGLPISSSCVFWKTRRCVRCKGTSSMR